MLRVHEDDVHEGEYTRPRGPRGVHEDLVLFFDPVGNWHALYHVYDPSVNQSKGEPGHCANTSRTLQKQGGGRVSINFENTSNTLFC